MENSLCQLVQGFLPSTIFFKWFTVLCFETVFALHYLGCFLNKIQPAYPLPDRDASRKTGVSFQMPSLFWRSVWISQYKESLKTRNPMLLD